MIRLLKSEKPAHGSLRGGPQKVVLWCLRFFGSRLQGVHSPAERVRNYRCRCNTYSQRQSACPNQALSIPLTCSLSRPYVSTRLRTCQSQFTQLILFRHSDLGLSL